MKNVYFCIVLVAAALLPTEALVYKLIVDAIQMAGNVACDNGLLMDPNGRNCRDVKTTNMYEEFRRDVWIVDYVDNVMDAAVLAATVGPGMAAAQVCNGNAACATAIAAVCVKSGGCG